MDVLQSIATAAAGGFNPVSLFAALLPLLNHAGTALVNKYIAPDVFKPSTLADYLAMKKADLDLFTAINGADGNQETYKWVAAIKQLQRPVVVIVVCLTWTASLVFQFNTDAINTFAQAVGFYLFADRQLFYLQQPGKTK